MKHDELDQSLKKTVNTVKPSLETKDLRLTLKNQHRIKPTKESAG
jgi:hypothetical protein